MSSLIPNFGTDVTHVEDLKGPDGTLLLSGNLFHVALRESEPEVRTPFTPHDGFPLDLGHGPEVEKSVIGFGSLSVRIASLTHVVNLQSHRERPG